VAGYFWCDRIGSMHDRGLSYCVGLFRAPLTSGAIRVAVLAMLVVMLLAPLATAAVVTFEDKTAFFSAIGQVATTLDFEAASGFPKSGQPVGVYRAVVIDGMIVDRTNGKLGSGLTQLDGSLGAVVDFKALSNRPHSDGFQYESSQPQQLILEAAFSDGTTYRNDRLMNAGPGEQLYFGLTNSETTISSIRIYAEPVTGLGGTAGSATFFAARASVNDPGWLIDDLTMDVELPPAVEPGTVMFVLVGGCAVAVRRRGRD
jgi:hypothetical protein